MEVMLASEFSNNCTGLRSSYINSVLPVNGKLWRF
jgi:hypothetical protein